MSLDAESWSIYDNVSDGLLAKAFVTASLCGRTGEGARVRFDFRVVGRVATKVAVSFRYLIEWRTHRVPDNFTITRLRGCAR